MSQSNAPRYRRSLVEARTSTFQRARAARQAAEREQSLVKRYQRIVHIRKRYVG